MSITPDSIIVALKASQQDLRAENARLQERVKEAEAEIGLLDSGNAVWLKVNERLIHERDEAKALAEQLGEALELAVPLVETLVVMGYTKTHGIEVAPAHDAIRAAVDATPDVCGTCRGKSAVLVNPPNDADFVPCPECGPEEAREKA